MKKLLLALGIVALATSCSFAEIDVDETTSTDNLRLQGYSESMARIVDTVKSKNASKGESYVKNFSQPQRTKFGNIYHNIKMYFDPSQDDGKFGEHEIDFSNSWQGDNVHYSSPLVEKTNIENL